MEYTDVFRVKKTWHDQYSLCLLSFPLPSIQARAGNGESTKIQGIHIQFLHHFQAFRLIYPLSQPPRETEGLIHFDLIIPSMTTFVIRTPTSICICNLPDEVSIPFFHAQDAFIMSFPKTYNSPRGKICDPHIPILVACVEEGI